MLSIAFFGVTCEVLTKDEEYSKVSRDHFSMTWQEAEASGLNPPALNTHSERPRRETQWVATSELFAPLDQLPRHMRRRCRWYRWQYRWHWWLAQGRRKKRTALRLTEFAELSDGRRITVRSDRGFSWSWKHSPSAFHRKTQESFTDNIRNLLAQYEEDRPTRPEWIAERLQRLYGIEIGLASVYDAMRAPLRVEFGPRLLEQLPQ